MKLKIYFWAIETFIECIMMMYHELCHYVVCLFWYCLGFIEFPRFYIDQHPGIEMNEKGSFTQYGAWMSVNYKASPNLSKKIKNSITIAPAFGCVFLFVISPIYMWLLYINHLNALWMSCEDVNDLKSKE